MNAIRPFLLSLGLVISIGGLQARDHEVLSEARGRNGMVVSVSPPATAAGVEVLKAGGNAVDAAIAVEFALAVTWPEAGNIGGGGFMIVHPADGGEVVCIDYRETAPGAATETMFTPEDGKHTHKIVGVPGTVHGMATAHQRFGKLPWKDLVMPAVKLAAEGFEIDEPLAGSINGVLGSPEVRKGKHHEELLRVFGKPVSTSAEPTAAAIGDDCQQAEVKKPPLAKWSPGDRLIQPDLAKTLRLIAESGADGFYRGENAERIAAEMKRGDGIITAEDLAGYEARIRPVVHGKFRGHDIYGPPPPSSGGVSLVLMLNVLNEFDLREYDRFSARNLHVLTETMRRAFCDRARFLGDRDSVKIPGRLTRKWYARNLAKAIDLEKATPSEALAPELKIADESPSTTHFSVIDGDGMAVSNTTTLEASWGARIVVKGAGFVLNNEMGDFNWFPGHTDRKGRIGTRANRIAPGKRMLSSQTPTIVARDGKPVLITGSPGGRTIINTSLQMVLNVIEFNMDLPEAMRAERIHHQWLPDKISIENHRGRISEDALKELKEKGHEISVRGAGSFQGDAHSIRIDPKTGEYHGVADWRLSGSAAGY